MGVNWGKMLRGVILRREDGWGGEATALGYGEYGVLLPRGILLFPFYFFLG